MSRTSWTLRHLWLLTTPVTAFRGWEVSPVAVAPALERILFALSVSVFPVLVIIHLVEARERGTLGDWTFVPWWVMLPITLLIFPCLFGAISLEYDRAHGQSLLAAVLMMLMWTAPQAVALCGLAISRRDVRPAMPIVDDADKAGD